MTMINGKGVLASLEKSAEAAKKRRLSFKKCGHDMGFVFRGFLGEAGLGTDNPTPEIEAAAKVLLEDKIRFREVGTAVLAAQFATRLLNTRAQMEEAARRATRGTFKANSKTHIEQFVEGAVERNVRFHLELLPACILMSSDTAARALQVYSGEAARVVLEALFLETHQNEHFDEAAFWSDVFRGFADADSSGWMVKGFSAIFLDHVPEFRAAIANDAAEVMRSKLRVVHTPE